MLQAHLMGCKQTGASKLQPNELVPANPTTQVQPWHAFPKGISPVAAGSLHSRQLW